LLADIKKIISKEEILKSLEVVNLLEEKNKLYGKYSYGMKQKLSIAQAIMEPSDILILDEPFNGIDINSTEKIKKYLLTEKREDKIIIITSHIKEDLQELCDEIIELENGSLNEVPTN